MKIIYTATLNPLGNLVLHSERVHDDIVHQVRNSFWSTKKPVADCLQKYFVMATREN